MPIAPDWNATGRASLAAHRIERPTAGTIAQQALRTASNLPIKVPSVDWAKVFVGEKRMFRWYAKGASALPTCDLPCPCLLYSSRRVHRGIGHWEATPGILTACRQEPLGAIPPADVAAEGFEFLPAFRWYWKMRNKRLGWRPWDLVNVYEVRPLFPEDIDWVKQWIFDRLYREWL